MSNSYGFGAAGAGGAGLTDVRVTLKRERRILPSKFASITPDAEIGVQSVGAVSLLIEGVYEPGQSVKSIEPTIFHLDPADGSNNDPPPGRM